jgi:hypothetical protein
MDERLCLALSINYRSGTPAMTATATIHQSGSQNPATREIFAHHPFDTPVEIEQALAPSRHEGVPPSLNGLLMQVRAAQA